MFQRGFGGAFASRSGESSGSSGKAAFNIVARKYELLRTLFALLLTSK